MNLLTTLLAPIAALFTRQKNLYALDHAVLNIQVPPRTMWMNMGYWEQETDLPEASRALLDQVMLSAGFIDNSSQHGNIPRQEGEGINLIDVGFGCGDQTLYLAKHFPWLFRRYIGITMVPSQTALAESRLSLDEDIASTVKDRITLFTADAGDPSSWDTELQHAIASTTQTQTKTQAQPRSWLLALDSLYHFRPSRRAFLDHGCSRLDVSLMAFDLILADSTSVWNRFLLWVVCWVAGIPFANFVAKDDYVAMLVRAGYEIDKIEVRDISGNVFGGLAGFIRRKDAELKRFGLGVGRYKVACRLFEWWARSGVVKGVVVVARK